MIDSLGAIESISPIDRLTVRLAEWARLGSQNLVEPQGVPYATWVGPRRTPKPVIDRTSNDVTIRVIDRASGEVIRTIPPDQLMSAMHELNISTGALIETVL